MKKLLLPLLALLIFSCSKEDPEPEILIDSPTLDIKYDQQHEFKLKRGSEDLFASTFNWISSDEKVGKIDANGIFKSRKIGKTTITGTSKEGSKTVLSEIIVSPYTSFITEPSLEFGATKSTIKSQEKRTLTTETDEVLLFEDPSSMIRFVGYFFEGGRYQSSVVLFENNNSAIEPTTTFYKERYPDRGPLDDKVGLLDDSRKYGIIISVDATLGFNAFYLPYDGGGRAPVNSQDIIKKAFIKAIILQSPLKNP